MRIFFHSDQLKHNPKHEILGGRVVDYMETPSRALSVLAACASCRSDGSQLGPVIEPADHGLQPILAIHSAEFIEHSKTRNPPHPPPPSPIPQPMTPSTPLSLPVYSRWIAEGGNPDGALPECWPARCFQKFTPCIGGRIAGNSSCSAVASTGAYCYDMSCVVTADTWNAVYWSGACLPSRACARESAIFPRRVRPRSPPTPSPNRNFRRHVPAAASRSMCRIRPLPAARPPLPRGHDGQNSTQFVLLCTHRHAKQCARSSPTPLPL